MAEKHIQTTSRSDLALQPAVYEIRVKGRLEGEIWSQWFEGMTVMVEESGETTLRGPLTDQSALYGLLSRLRDLAVPLLSVNISGMEPSQVTLPPNECAPHKGGNWLMILLYLLLIGALASLTVFLTSDLDVSVSLALGALFILLSGSAHMISRYDNRWWWRVLTILNGIGAAPPLIIFMIEVGVPTALAITILLLLAASGLVYLIFLQQQGQNGRRVSRVRWEKLGQRSPEDPEGR